ncbi:probable G-protein coupled receptor 160 [Pristis pectinata]|uniref:probable G-protein coupled receptor 160 n=1 Tax=Pristis pectinata TaxID=685728 RepID=UPI00223E4EFA|nr:probable G-protein coupled receptor 160 [Pristis pectinata]XP_051874109.1 probable G-protein coupled receptor 160 [Pristis pectinata]XP_051874110.1 probable G-protein coupled receptor 160 [Pristis pectinata]
MYLFQIFNNRNLLLIILFVKVILNWLILSIKRRMLWSLIGHFCISLSLMDVALFTSMMITSFFKTCDIFGAPIGFFQVCLILQFFSNVYSVLHFPICLLSGLDYLVNLRNLSKSISVFRRILYNFTVVFLWIGAIVYASCYYNFNLPMLTTLDSMLYQCDVPIGIQSLVLSALILITLVLVTIYCWSNLTSLVRSLHVDTYLNEVVMWSSHPAAQLQPQSSKKQILTNVAMCFSVTWMPFILLQLTIVLIWAPLPAYMDLNVPWLCFINSFLIGTVYWMNHKDIPPDVIPLIPDGFCHWDCCKLQQVPLKYNGKWFQDNEIKGPNILMA